MGKWCYWQIIVLVEAVVLWYGMGDASNVTASIIKASNELAPQYHNFGYISIRYVSFIYKVHLYPETGTQKSV